MNIESSRLRALHRSARKALGELFFEADKNAESVLRLREDAERAAARQDEIERGDPDPVPDLRRQLAISQSKVRSLESKIARLVPERAVIDRAERVEREVRQIRRALPKYKARTEVAEGLVTALRGGPPGPRARCAECRRMCVWSEFASTFAREQNGDPAWICPRCIWETIKAHAAEIAERERALARWVADHHRAAAKDGSAERATMTRAAAKEILGSYCPPLSPDSAFPIRGDMSVCGDHAPSEAGAR